MTIERLPASQTDIAVETLCDAFRDYPVMRYVLGSVRGYDVRLETLVRFFVSARVHRQEPVFAVRDGDTVVGAALVTLPGDRPAPAALAAGREATWRAIGSWERARYESFGAATKAFAIDSPHHHLNMIGVRRSHAGRGFARILLEAVHALAAADPASSGVSLTTEDEQNLPFYEHFGYHLQGHVRAGKALDTWGFFRPRDNSNSNRR